MSNERQELMVQVKLSRSFIESFRDHTDRPHFRCILPAAIKGVHQKNLSKFLALVRLADSQAPEKRGRKHGIPWHLFRDAFGQLRETDGKTRKSVVANHRAGAVNHNERRRHFPFGILARLEEEVLIEFGTAAGKRRAIVVSERFNGVSGLSIHRLGGVVLSVAL